MKKIIFTRPDGGLSVIHPVINTHPVVEDITEEAALQRAMKDVPGDAINPQVVDETAIPTDRTFRDAWTHGGTNIEVDMGKAVEIQKNKLRELRAPLLLALDGEFMRALEVDDTKARAEIAVKKQALRDVTADPALEAAETPEELKAVMPAALELQAGADSSKESL